MFIDNGKPTPDLIARTVDNLREISPSLYFNVPRGYAMLLPYLESDSDLRDRFFQRLKLIFYAGAALPNDLWERLRALSIAARGGSFRSSRPGVRRDRAGGNRLSFHDRGRRRDRSSAARNRP